MQSRGWQVSIGTLTKDALQADAIIAQPQDTDLFNFLVYVLHEQGMPVFIDKESGKCHPNALDRASGVIDFPTYVEQWQIDFTPRAKSQVTVGWVGPRTADIASIRLLVRRMERQYGVQFRTVGEQVDLGLSNYKHFYRPSKHDDYYRLLNFDVALLPLADGNVDRRVIDTLVTEYTAAGIPIVGNEGPGTDFIHYGFNGYTVGANESRDWGRGLDRLIGDAEHRALLSRRAKAMAQSRSIETNFYRYEHLLDKHLSFGSPERAKRIEFRAKELLSCADQTVPL